MFRSPFFPISLAVLISYFVIGKFSGDWNPISQFQMTQIIGSTEKVACYVAFLTAVIGIARGMCFSFLTPKTDFKSQYNLNASVFAYFNLMILAPIALNYFREDRLPFGSTLIAIVAAGYVYLVFDLVWSHRKMTHA